MEEKKHCKWYNEEMCTNDKSPCVADYCPVVEYPELCKHREVDEDINVRSKTEDKRKKILANRVYTDETLKRWKKEDLIEQIRILEHNWSCAEESYNNSVKNSEKIFAEQKAEIGRLTEENSNLKKLVKSLEDLKETLLQGKAELQKQVDEFTSVFGNADNFARTISDLRMKNGNRVSTSKELCEWVEEQKQQAVKDTTREILQGFNKWLNQAISDSYGKSVGESVRSSGIYYGKNTAFHEVKELVKKVAESKGVEVE